jgi:hypothetical protein
MLLFLSWYSSGAKEVLQMWYRSLFSNHYPIPGTTKVFLERMKVFVEQFLDK